MFWSMLKIKTPRCRFWFRNWKWVTHSKLVQNASVSYAWTTSWEFILLTAPIFPLVSSHFKNISCYFHWKYFPCPIKWSISQHTFDQISKEVHGELHDQLSWKSSVDLPLEQLGAPVCSRAARESINYSPDRRLICTQLPRTYKEGLITH